jgi:hypothetical protein
MQAGGGFGVDVVFGPNEPNDPPPARTPRRLKEKFDRETRLGKFVREAGSVVLGVLIALGIGEAAEWVRARLWAAETTEAINAELARNAGVFDERQLMQPCVERRIATLAGLIREVRRTRKLPEIGAIGQTPFRTVELAAWRLASSTDVMLDLNPKLRTTLTMTYPMIEEYTSGVADEQELWASLRVIQRSPGPISEDMLTQVATDIERLDHRARLNGIKVAQILAAVQHSGIANDYSVAWTNKTKREQVVADVRERSMCQPLTVDGKPYAGAAVGQDPSSGPPVRESSLSR